MIKPLFMWAGGKTKLIKKYEPIFEKIEYSTYVEPFFGGGAVFCWKHADADNLIINDLNRELMGIYRAISDDHESFIKSIQEELSVYFEQKDRKQYYYNLRKSYWQDPNPGTLFVLMKLGFNGFWKTCKDSNGLYGTAAGLLNHKNIDKMVDFDNIREWSVVLGNTRIESKSYQDLTIQPDGALIYLDPPYRGSFAMYGSTFGDNEQKELTEWANDMASSGATVLLANRCTNDTFFETLLPNATFNYFDVTYTAGRRKVTKDGYMAVKAREFLAKL